MMLPPLVCVEASALNPLLPQPAYPASHPQPLRSTFDEHCTYPMDASILIVGQDEFCQSILDSILPSTTLTLEVAPDPQEAFPLIQAQQPDLVILSLKLSGVMALCRNIREKNRLTWIYCIVVDDASTAHALQSLPASGWDIAARTPKVFSMRSPSRSQPLQDQPPPQPNQGQRLGESYSNSDGQESENSLLESYSPGSHLESAPGNADPSPNRDGADASEASEKMILRQAQFLAEGADAFLALNPHPTPSQIQLLRSQIQAGLRRVQSHREIVRTNDLLSAIALSDPLTELNNRRALEWELPRQIRNARDRGAPISLLMMDVDFFKSINDQYGHLVGDRALKLISARLRHNLRFYDTPFRYGGEEFVIILNNTSAKEAFRIGQRLCSLMATQTFNISDDLALTITVSAGVATLQAKDDDKGISLLRRADQFLLKAKSQGRNRVLSAEIKS